MAFLATIVNWAFNIYIIIIFARAVFSWVRVDPYHPTWGPIMRFTYQATEPLMAPIRRLLPPTGGIDFSPIIVLVGLSFLRTFVVGLLYSL